MLAIVIQRENIRVYTLAYRAYILKHTVIADYHVALASLKVSLPKLDNRRLGGSMLIALRIDILP